MESIHRYISLIKQKGVYDLVAEARRGYLGVMWWVLEPLLYMLAFYLVFVVVFNRDGEDRVAFLLIGLVVWKWFDSSVRQCSNCIASNIGLIRQVYIHKSVFVGMVVTTSTIKFLIVFSLLLVFLLVTNDGGAVSWISLLVLMFLQLFLMVAIGSVLAAIVPFVPDLRLLIDNGMMLLFFLSGVFFDIGADNMDLKAYFYVNPMFGLIENYRSVLLHGEWPDWVLLTEMFFSGVVLLSIGFWLLHRFDRDYAKVI